MPQAQPLPGYVYIEIPFPPPGSWMDEGQKLDLGRFEQGLCSGNLFKTINNKLYVFAEFQTWGGRFIKADMPLHVPAEDGVASILHIRWADTGVRLQQDARQPIDVAWQPPH